jgi:hypothetical protein
MVKSHTTTAETMEKHRTFARRLVWRLRERGMKIYEDEAVGIIDGRPER